MTMTAERLRLLHGSDAPIAEMRSLRAGPVTMLLDGVDLRYLRLGDTELVRRVYVAVRDVDWDTVPGTVSGLEVEQGDASFRVEFDARHARREIDFSWHGTITGDDSGRVEVVLDGRAEDVLPYNRIGICVHHPWRETKAARFRARTPDGDVEATFPDEIGPQAFVDGAYHALFPPTTGSRSTSQQADGCCSSSKATCGRRRITATGRTRTSRRTRHRSASAARRRSRPARCCASAS